MTKHSVLILEINVALSDNKEKKHALCGLDLIKSLVINNMHKHSAVMNCAMITQVAPCTFLRERKCSSKVLEFIAFLSAVINNKRQRSQRANMIT